MNNMYLVYRSGTMWVLEVDSILRFHFVTLAGALRMGEKFYPTGVIDPR